MFVKTQVRQFMREELTDRSHPDLWEGGYAVNCSRLAENAANHFGFEHWLDDDTHWVWDLAVEEGERAEEAHEAEWTSRQGGR